MTTPIAANDAPPEVPASAYRAGAQQAIPFAAVLVGFAVSFGVLARAAGMSPLAAVAMSATTFAGSAQFAAVGVLAQGGSLSTAAITAVLLNSRYLPIGLSVAPAMTGPWWSRLARAQMIVDESWAIGRREDGRYDAQRIVGAGLLLYAVWVGGTALGSLGANVLADPHRLGIDAAFPAVFLGLLIPQLREARAAIAAVLAVTVALALVPVAPAGVPLLAASTVCLIGLLP